MKSWREHTAREVMEFPVTSLDRSMPLSEAVATLTDEQISGAPVVDSKNRALGVVSFFDIASYLAGLDRSLGRLGSFYSFADGTSDDAAEGWLKVREIGEENLLEETQIGDLMNEQVISVAPETGMPQVVDIMKRNRIHRILVVEDEQPVGIITTTDLLGILWEEDRAARKLGQ